MKKNLSEKLQFSFYYKSLKKEEGTRAGLAQSVEHSTTNHKIPGSIPALVNSAYE